MLEEIFGVKWVHDVMMSITQIANWYHFSKWDELIYSKLIRISKLIQ